MATDPAALHSLITAALAEKGWTAADLHRALTDAGVTLSFSAVYLWTTGGGVADKHRPVLARVLGVPLERLALAAAGLRQESAAGAA
jgi:transposase InsO family protein